MPNPLDRKGVSVSGLVIAPWPLRDDELANPKRRMIVHAIKNASIGDLAGLSYFDYLIRDLVVQATMLRDAVYLMFQASKNYVYVLKNKNKKAAYSWI